MMPSWFPVEGKTYVVLGLARSGLATVKWLLARGASVIAVDDNPDKIVAAQKLGAETPPTIPWNEITALIQSPGIPLWFPIPHPITQQARENGVPVIGDGDLLRAAYPEARFVGITGTNGKSTTTALVSHILKTTGIDCQVGGNIGVPMLDLPPAQTYVLELSSYQLDLSGGLDLHVAAWLNISPDHLDRHGSLENYIAVKKRIFKAHSSAQTAIIGVDDAASEAVWQELLTTQPVIPVSVKRNLGEGVCFQENWLMDGSDRVLDVTTLPALKGVHNFQNVAIAYGVCKTLGLEKSEIIEAMQTFPGLAHRQECVGMLKNIQFINDSKGTNADATAKALATFDKIYWIAGGKAKSDGIESLSSYFPKIVHTFLIGEAQEEFAHTLEGRVPYTKSGTMEQAVTGSYQLALANGIPNSIILLSPACASFDQFEDFEHRGNVFCQLVRSLEKTEW
jgi:UDP-N-acetylmuramoylalanine--D-glutamate ligase